MWNVVVYLVFFLVDVVDVLWCKDVFELCNYMCGVNCLVLSLRSL